MSGAVWVAVAVGLLVLLAVAAVTAARWWRDPPPDEWDLSAQMRDAADRDPVLAEYRIRRDFGIRDDLEWAEISRAVEAGRAAPVPLRSAARAVAQVRIRTLRRELSRPRWMFALGLLALPEGLLALIPGPRAQRRRLHRIETALASNAEPRPT